MGKYLKIAKFIKSNTKYTKEENFSRKAASKKGGVGDSELVTSQPEPPSDESLISSSSPIQEYERNELHETSPSSTPETRDTKETNYTKKDGSGHAPTGGEKTVVQGYETNELHEESPSPARPLARVLPPVSRERRSGETTTRSSAVSGAETRSDGPEVGPEFFLELRKQQETARKAEEVRLEEKRRKAAKRRKTDPEEYSQPFGAWLARRWRDAGSVGELVRAFRNEPDESYPEYWQDRLEAVSAHRGHVQALRQAISQWKKECKK